jgi:formylglycine-generating enzyme required for sulfatase activity
MLKERDMRSLRKKAVILISLLLTLSMFLACTLDGTTDPIAGDITDYTAESVTFKMVYIPGGITFPTGTDDSVSETVTNAYWIGETEVTYELWNAVHAWATHTDRGANIYYFANPGTMGDGTDDTVQHPVTFINWRDAMVWMNALTEYYNAQNGTSFTIVYKDSGTPVRDSREANGATCDKVEPDSSATGFRLLTSDEWELAARYIDDANSNNTLDSGEYYPGNYASGADAQWDIASGGSDIDGDGDIEYTSDVAVYSESDSTAAVKSKSLNALGLYDMSGNVWEWVFDLYNPSERMMRGGSWRFSAASSSVGEWEYDSPDYVDSDVGFRFARTR